MSEANETPKVDEPTLTLCLEEVSLIFSGLNNLPTEHQKTVVFDRLMMKLDKVRNYWHKVEQLRRSKLERMKAKLLDKDNAPSDI